MLQTNAADQTDSQPAQVHTIAELLKYDGYQFIEIVYLTLLKRPPDSTGGQFYLDRLADGISKIQILNEIGASEESTGDVVSNMGLVELLNLNGQQFVDGAHQTLLGRLPDFAGGKAYLERLLSGTSKLQILDEIASSGEHKESVVVLPGLHHAVARYKKAERPVWGALFRFFSGAEGSSSAEIRARSVEQHVLLLCQQMHARLDRLERNVADLSELKVLLAEQSEQVKRSKPRSVDAPAIPSSSSAMSLAPPLVLESAGVSKIPIRAIELYLKLKAAAARAAGGHC